MQFLIDRGYVKSEHTETWYKGLVCIEADLPSRWRADTTYANAWEPNPYLHTEAEAIAALEVLESENAEHSETLLKNAGNIAAICEAHGFALTHKYVDGVFEFSFESANGDSVHLFRLGYDPTEEDDMQFEVASNFSTVYAEKEFDIDEILEVFEVLKEDQFNYFNRRDQATFVVVDEVTVVFRTIDTALVACVKFGAVDILYEELTASFDYAGTTNIGLFAQGVDLPSIESYTVTFRNAHDYPRA